MSHSKVDPRLVGVWKGTDHGNYAAGEVNSWVITRYADGRLEIEFETVVKAFNFRDISTQTGIWYVEGDYYFEKIDFDPLQHEPDETDLLDCYVYSVLSHNIVQFIDTQLTELGKVYQFMDIKILTR